MEELHTIQHKSDLYGIQKPNVDQLIYCREGNSIYHLRDISRKDKSDGWEIVTSAVPSISKVTSSGTIDPNAFLTKAQSDARYVKYQYEYNADPSLAPLQIILGDVNVIGNIYAYGEISAFQGTSPTNWWNNMPVATTTSLGGIKVGANLSIDSNGFLNATGGGGGGGTWGSIAGNISDQSDLVGAFALKADLNNPNFTGTVSGIDAAMVGLSNVTNDKQWCDAWHPTLLGDYGITDAASIYGVPVQNQVALWWDANSIFGREGITYDGTTLTITGNITATGEISAFTGSAPDNWWDNMPAPTTTTRGGIFLGGGSTRFLREDNTWQTVTGGSGGTSDHHALSNLDFANSGHIGFAAQTHNLVSSYHNVSGLNSGDLLVALSGTTYGFSTITAATLGGVLNGDSRLSNSRIASDVYAWAKTITKPSYSYTEVGAAAASHTHNYEPANSNIQTHISSMSNPHSTTASQVGLGNVTNESKATMFTNSTFTGNPRIALVTGNTGLIFSWNGTDGTTIDENQIGIRANADFYINTYTTGNANIHIGRSDKGTTTIEGLCTIVGALTISSIKTPNFTIMEESGKFVIKYGSTIIGSISNAGFLKMKDEIGAFETP